MVTRNTGGDAHGAADDTDDFSRILGEPTASAADAEATAAIDPSDDEPGQDAASPLAGPTDRVSGWKRVFRGNRTLWLVAGVAIVSLAAGLLVQRFVISPSEAAANSEPPAPGLVTAPVEFGQLSNDVTIRADIGYADAVEVKIAAGGSEGAPIVTGKVPAAGDVVEAKNVILEVAGRPVIVLPGELPAYRSLRIGLSGPDVVQLRQALAAVGIDTGDVTNGTYDQSLADGVRALYEAVGYTPPTGDESAAMAYRAAQASVTDAEKSVGQAESELSKAGAGPTEAEVAAANTRVAQAEAELARTRATPGVSAEEIAASEAGLIEARTGRDALWGAKDTSAAQSSVDAARDGLGRAQEDLEIARQGVQAYLPVEEVLFLQQLPRRVNEVNVSRGSALSGAAMTVSGATVRLTGAAAEADAKLLQVGAEATVTLEDDSVVPAKVTEITPGESGKRWSVILEPTQMTPEQITAAQGTNVRVSIPVGSSDGEVLSVPLAALTAGPGGDSRVEVVDSDPREGEDADTHLVTVTTGLSAGGFVEITPTEGDLAEGDLVVIGR